MVQMAFCDLSHTCHKLVINVSQHGFVILLWGILKSEMPDTNTDSSADPSKLSMWVQSLTVNYYNWKHFSCMHMTFPALYEVLGSSKKRGGGGGRVLTSMTPLPFIYTCCHVLSYSRNILNVMSMDSNCQVHPTIFTADMFSWKSILDE